MGSWFVLSACCCRPPAAQPSTTSAGSKGTAHRQVAVLTVPCPACRLPAAAALVKRQSLQPPTMYIYDLRSRHLAADSWLEGRRKLPEATKIFKQKCPPPLPARPDKFVKFWGKRWDKTHSVADKPGKGRKSTVDLSLVRQAVELFAAGYQHEGYRLHWGSFELAVRFDGQLADLLQKSGYTPRTFFAYMQQVTAVVHLPRHSAG